MRKNTYGVLSPDWAVKYARDCLSDVKHYKGVTLHNSRIKGQIRALREAEQVILKVGPVMAKDDHGRYGRFPDTLLRVRIGHTCKTLREAGKFLQELLKAGRPVNVMINRAVLGLSKEFEKRDAGRPHYREVGEIITVVFANYLPKTISDHDVEDWAEKTAKRYEKTLKNEQSFNRALMGYIRKQLNNPLTNPSLIYNPQPPSRTDLPPELWSEVKAGKRTLLG